MQVHIGLDARHAVRNRDFRRHFFEMTAAMVVGMCVLGAGFRQIHLAVFGTGFDDAWHQHTALAMFAMAFNMTLPMVAWMRHRGHNWERCGEMAAAMFAPMAVLTALFWLGAISAQVALPMQMALMLPCMLLAMLYRFDDYSNPLHRPAAGAVPPGRGAPGLG
jgi:flagellar biosynthetic protein FliP